VIVKRVHKPPLIGDSPLNTPQRIIDKQVIHSDDDKWMVYEIDEKYQPHHKIKLILLRNVDEYGNKGQIVNVFFHDAYKYLLLPKFAVYHTEENAEIYKDILIPEDDVNVSSEAVRKFISRYSKRVFDISMNIEQSWTIQPWHIKASLRKHKLWVKTEDIEIPGGQIEGPDMSLEGKEFIAVISINNEETLPLRCVVHHCGENAVKTPGWYIKQGEPVWESERQALLDMNRSPPNKKMREIKEFKEDIEIYDKWRVEGNQGIQGRHRDL